MSGFSLTGLYDPDPVLTAISQGSGYLSLIIWLFAQLPQIIENHLNQSVAGINVWFLSSWIAGDMTNLVGCLLTGALPFQTLIASYYCFIDVVLSFQYYYYTHIFPYHKTPHNLLQSPDMMRHNSASSPNFLILDRNNPRRLVDKIVSAGLLATKVKKARAMPVSPTSSLVDAAEVFITYDDIGKLLAWICSFFYLLARVPQIITNYKNKATVGISPFLFLFAMLGNSFYTISISVDLWLEYRHQEPGRFNDVMNQVPFLIGSGGTVIFDFMILLQFWLYKENNRYIKAASRSRNGSRDTSRARSRSSTKSRSKSRSKLKSKASQRSTTSQKSKPELSPSDRSKLINYDQGFQKPGWYVNQFDYEDDDNVVNPFASALDEINSPPPHHYIQTHTQAHYPQHSLLSPSNQNQGSSKAQPIINSIKSIRSNSSSIHSSSNVNTGLIPSIINSYSSVNKKMSDDTKTPFLPSDFLHDDFHHPIENSLFDLNN